MSTYSYSVSHVSSVHATAQTERIRGIKYLSTNTNLEYLGGSVQLKNIDCLFLFFQSKYENVSPSVFHLFHEAFI